MLEVPPPLPRWQSVLFPFSWWVWGAIILSICCSALTYHLLGYKEEPSFINSCIVILQSILSNPMETVPIKWRLRNFLMLWWIVSWFVNMSYTSNLIAVLTVPVFPTKLQTALDLSKSNYRLCMVDYGEFVDEALAESTHPVLSELYKILDMVPTVASMAHNGEEQCVDRVMAGTHAHTETYSYVKILFNKLGHGANQVYSFQEQLYPGYLAFFVQKHVPWKYKFDVGMQWMLETGLIQKWYNDAMDYFSDYFETMKIFVLNLDSEMEINEETLPTQTISQPYPGTYDIMPTYHESTTPVLVTAMQKVIMILCGNTSAPLCIPMLNCTVCRPTYLHEFKELTDADEHVKWIKLHCPKAIQNATGTPSVVASDNPGLQRISHVAYCTVLSRNGPTRSGKASGCEEELELSVTYQHYSIKSSTRVNTAHRKENDDR
ncbi:ionotropic receptor 21a-like [Palaemon carinicauda]|uniref:ionotropic receptor 21a-like n=1 Tax=Palaemon carinicauda TaxID=392227 RepID=UPI0035B5C503